VPPVGLRERKKDETRQYLAEVAFRLFAERGFDAVTVAEIATAAGVAAKTVFNYFPVKEDLVLGARAENDAMLLAALAERGDKSVPEIVRQLSHRVRERVAAQPREHRLAYRRIVGGTASLSARWREVMAQLEREIALIVADELGQKSGDVLPLLVASGLTIVYGRLAYCDVEPRADGSYRSNAAAAADIDRAIALIAAQLETEA
jgi:AcrR family transcriptional regulator